MAGRTDTGLGQLQLAVVTATDPTVMAKILVRRGRVRYFIHRRPTEALADLERALPGLRAADELVWEARALNLVGLSALALGRAEHAARAVESAERIFVQEGQVVEAVVTLHNRGQSPAARGDLPSALRLYDAAAEGYATSGKTRRDSSTTSAKRCWPWGWPTRHGPGETLRGQRIAAGRRRGGAVAQPVDGRAGRRSRSGSRERNPRASAVPAPAPGVVGAASELAALLARREGGAGGRRLAEELPSWQRTGRAQLRGSRGRVAAGRAGSGCCRSRQRVRAPRAGRRVPTPAVCAGPGNRLARARPRARPP